MLTKIDSLCIGLKNLHTKQFRKIIYTKFRINFAKFREMYCYLKNLHNETISRNKVQRNLEEFHKISRN
jgi:hypothetical protein